MIAEEKIYGELLLPFIFRITFHEYISFNNFSPKSLNFKLSELIFLHYSPNSMISIANHYMISRMKDRAREGEFKWNTKVMKKILRNYQRYSDI